MELRFTTFTSIINGNLMPWLAENQDQEKYRLLLRKIGQAESGTSSSFFIALSIATRDLGLNPGQKLTDEWELFSEAPTHPDASGLAGLFMQLQDDNPKLVFYTALIAHSMANLFSMITLHIVESQSQALRKHRSMNYMKSLSDMIIIARELHPTGEVDCTIIHRLLAGMAMLFAETGNRFPEYIEPSMLKVNNADTRNIFLAPDYRDENTRLLFTSLSVKYFSGPAVKLVVPSSLPKDEEHLISIPPHSDPFVAQTSDTELLREVVKMKEDLAGLMKDVTRVINKKEAHPKSEVQLIGSAEVCKILHISKSTLKAHREQKLYSFTKIGSRFLYSSIEINNILELRKHK